MSRTITRRGIWRNSFAIFDSFHINIAGASPAIFAIKDIFAIFNIQNINDSKNMIAITAILCSFSM